MAPTSNAGGVTNDPDDDASAVVSHPLASLDSSDDARARVEVSSAASMPSLVPPPDAAHLRVTTRAKSDSTVLSWITVLARPASFDAATSTVESGRSRGVAYERLRSASDGSVEFAVEPGVPFVVHAFGRDRGYDMQEASVPALAPNQSVDVVLELSATGSSSYWLHLIDEETDRPIAGCEVVMESAGDRRRRTDDAGLVALPPSAAERPLSIEVLGYGRHVIVTKLGHDTPKDAVVLKLARAAQLRVRTLTPDGTPLADQSVVLCADSSELSSPSEPVSSWDVPPRPVTWSTRTDADGRGTFENLTPRVSYLASSNDFPEFQADDDLNFAPGEVRVATWILGGSCTLRGRVTDQFGKPVSGSSLWLARVAQGDPQRARFGGSAARTARTDDSGQFSFGSLATGTWELHGLRELDEYPEDLEESSVAAWRETVTIAAGQTSVDLLVHVDRGLSIAGTVFDASGKPIGSVRVSGRAVTVPDLVQGISGEDGTFRLGPVSNTEYDVSADGNFDEAQSSSVRARASATAIELRLRTGGRLQARLVGDVSERADVEVRLFPRASGSRSVASSFRHGGDTIDFSAQPEGEYFVTASTESGYVGGTTTIRVRTGDPTPFVEVPITPGGRVRVLTEAKDWNAWVDVSQRDVNYARVSLEPATPCVVHAPAGTVAIRITNAGADRRTIERTVEVRAGETTDLVIPADAR